MKILKRILEYFKIKELEKDLEMNKSCDRYKFIKKHGICQFSGSKGMLCRSCCDKYSYVLENPEKIFNECNLRLSYFTSTTPCELKCSLENHFCKMSCVLHKDNYISYDSKKNIFSI